jgi:hypothetical protein
MRSAFSRVAMCVLNTSTQTRPTPKTAGKWTPG